MARKPLLSPLADPPITQADVSSLAALFHRTANEDQQKRALDWILLCACRINSSTFDVDPIKSAYLQGRRDTGLMILNAPRTTPKTAQALADLNNGSEQ